MKYYISDLHLFHENAIKFDHRPFESVQEMHEVILKNWNDRVTNGDFAKYLCFSSFLSLLIPFRQNCESTILIAFQQFFSHIAVPGSQR